MGPSPAQAAASLVFSRAVELWGARCQQLEAVPVVVANVQACAFIALPHFIYAFIWFYPRVWRHWFGKKAADAFAMVGLVTKGGSCGVAAGACSMHAHLLLPAARDQATRPGQSQRSFRHLFTLQSV